MGRKRASVGLVWAITASMGVCVSMQIAIGGVSEASPTDEPTETQLSAPTLPEVQIRSIPGFDEEKDLRQELGQQVQRVVKSVQDAQSKKDRIERLSAAANLILSRQLEPQVTAKILDTKGLPGSESDTLELLNQADSLIQQAQTQLKDSESDESLDGIGDRLETLSAFATAMRAYLIPIDGAQKESNMRSAISSLSPVLEDGNIQIAAAANLWQACLRASEGDVARAIDILPFPAANIDKDAMPYPFFAKQLRCRLQTERGGHAGAIAMLIQMEERCDEWFEQKPDRADALRTTRWMQLRALVDWFGKFDATKQIDERKWCINRVKELTEESFSDDDKTVLRMSPSIPFVFPTPDLEPQPAAPSATEH